MQSLSQLDKGFRFLLSIDISSKYAWVDPLKDKKGVTIVNAFQEFLDKSGCKPNKKIMILKYIQYIMKKNLLLLKDLLEL